MREPSGHSATARPGSELARAGIGARSFLGMAFMVAGVFAILMPFVSPLAVTLIIGASLLVAGVAQVAHAFSKTWGGLLLHLPMGLIYVAGSLLFWFKPLTGAMVMTVALAAVLIAHGLGEFGLASRGRPEARWPWLVVSGAVAVFAGICLLLRIPLFGVLAPGILLGAVLVVEGAAFLFVEKTVPTSAPEAPRS